MQRIFGLPKNEIFTCKRGGKIFYKNNPDGSKSPYEINISYCSALSDINEPVEIKAKKLIAAYSDSI